jgi:Inositol-pentakisphosphate 2-kinase
MHSYFKSLRLETVDVGCCPLDLFSGDEPRVRRAVSALWDSWVNAEGSANNLKIFSRGKLLRSTEVSATPTDFVVELTPSYHHTDLDIQRRHNGRRSQLPARPVLRLYHRLAGSGEPGGHDCPSQRAHALASAVGRLDSAAMVLQRVGLLHLFDMLRQLGVLPQDLCFGWG